MLFHTEYHVENNGSHLWYYNHQDEKYKNIGIYLFVIT